MRIVIKHGLQTAVRDFDRCPTVDEIKRDSSLRAELGYGDNVRALIGGIEQPGYTPVSGGTVTIETASNQKATR